MIWASAAFAGYESIRKLAGHGHTTHVGAGIAAAALGIAGNQAVARYKLTVGRRIGSATLVGDAGRRRPAFLAGRPVLGRGAGRAGRGGGRLAVG